MITAEDINSLFAPQLDRIDDGELRDQVVSTWILACQRGGWDSLGELRSMPFTLLTETQGINFVEHTQAVTDGAVALAEAQINTYRSMPYPINISRLVAGGLLHDVGKLLEIEKDGQGGFRKSHSGKCARHPISGAILAAETGLPDEIVNMIACHAKEGEGRPQVVETILIHQADFATFNPLVFLEKNLLVEHLPRVQ